jgi:DNA-3-methyladenine glycosylase II
MAKTPRAARPKTLSPPHRAAQRHLAASHPVMTRLIERIGPCTFRPNPDLFTVIVHTVISQQISVKAADSIGLRLREAAGRNGLTPAAILKLSDGQLRAAGLSAAKQRSIRTIAARIAEGTLDLAALTGQSDADVFTTLRQVPGLGPWSVDMVLIFGLGRPDILPVGDFGLRMGVKEVYELPALPSPGELEELSQPWRPYRSVATWYFWRSRGTVPQSKG